MGSSSKGGGGAGSESYNYYGTIAGLVCVGEADELIGIEVDDKLKWQGSLLNSASSNPAPITIDGIGNADFYWGRDDQTTPHPLLSTAGNSLGHQHPAYTGVCYIVLKDILFGRERTSAPNIRVHVRRKPKQVLITGISADLNDGQANPYAVLAELFTSKRFGRGLSPSLFAATTWQASASFARTKSATSYVSLYLNSRTNGKSVGADLLALCDGWLRGQQSTGLSEAGYFTPPEEIDPNSLPIIDSDSLTTPPELTPDTWDDVKTRFSVEYTDRDHNYKKRTVKYDDPRSRFSLGENRIEDLKRPFIARSDQALSVAREMGRRFALPGLKGALSVRAERLANIRPGHHIRIDIDPEPGGTQLQQVCRVNSIRRAVKGAAKLNFEIERTLNPVLYQPGPTPEIPDPPAAVPAISHARFYEAPPGLADGQSYRVGILASRPDSLVTDYIVHYDDTPGGDFPRLGDSRSYALRARLTAAVDDADTGPFAVEILDAHNREIIAENPGETAARDDTLLMIVLKIAGSGQIEADSSDKAWIEVFSVDNLISTGTNLLNVTALRGRKGTPARDFALHDEVWFIPRANLTIVNHADFPDHAADTTNAYFKLQPLTISDARPLEDCAALTFNFALNREGGGPGGATTTIEWRYKRSTFIPERPTGNTPAGWSLSEPGGSDALWASFGHRETATGNILGDWSVPVRKSGNIIRFGFAFPTGDIVDDDAFIDRSDNNKIYRAEGGNWLPAFTPFIKTDVDGRVEGLQKADGTDGYWVMVATAFQIWNGTAAEAPFEVVGGFVYIKNAVIQNAAIGTLQIAGNAVTIPVSVSAFDALSGTGSPISIIFVNYIAPEAINVAVIFSALQGYLGAASYSYTLYIDGNFATYRAGSVANDTPNFCYSAYLAPGAHTFEVVWNGQNSNVGISDRTLVLLGTMR